MLLCKTLRNMIDVFLLGDVEDSFFGTLSDGEIIIVLELFFFWRRILGFFGLMKSLLLLAFLEEIPPLLSFC